MKVQNGIAVACIASVVVAVLFCCGTIENPYEAPPALELSTDTVTGCIGVPIDTVTVTVTNNVDVDQLLVFPELPTGLVLDAQNRTILGTPTVTAQGTYLVRAKNEYGNSDDAYIVVRIGPGKPGTPAIAAAERSVTLSWSQSEGATRYQVFRGGNDDALFNKQGETSGISYLDTTLVPGNIYLFYVIAVSGGDVPSVPSDTVQVVIGAAGDRPPVLAEIGSKSVDEGSRLTFAISADDPDSDAVSYSARNLPAGAILDTLSGVFSWTPGPSQAGVYTVSFVAVAGEGEDSQAVTITVSNVNRPPLLSSTPPESVGIGNTLVCTIDVSDEDGDSVFLELLDGPVGMKLSDAAVRWEVDWLSGYRPGDRDIRVSVRGVDTHGDADTLVWYVDIAEHEWHEAAVDLPAGYRLLAALGKDTLYARGDNTHGGEIHAKFGNAPWAKIADFGDSKDYPMIFGMRLSDGKLYVGGALGSLDSGMVASYELDGTGMQMMRITTTSTGDELYFDAAPSSGLAVLTEDYYSMVRSYGLYGQEGDTTWDCSELSNTCPTFAGIVTGGLNIVAFADKGLYGSSDGGISWTVLSGTASAAVSDGNNADTVYVVTDEATLNLRRYHFSGDVLSESWLFLSDGIAKVTQIAMISGTVGWVVDDQGDLYYTDDAFATVRKEALPANLSVVKLFLNRDTKRPYVYAGGVLHY